MRHDEKEITVTTQATAIAVVLVFGIVNSAAFIAPANAETARYNFSSCIVRVTGSGAAVIFKPGTVTTPTGGHGNRLFQSVKGDLL